MSKWVSLLILVLEHTGKYLDSKSRNEFEYEINSEIELNLHFQMILKSDFAFTIPRIELNFYFLNEKLQYELIYHRMENNVRYFSAVNAYTVLGLLYRP